MDACAGRGLSPGTLVFHNDLIVDRIVSHMSVVDRLRLYNDIGKEEGKWKPGSLNEMVKWKEAIETAELVISDSMDLIWDESREQFYHAVVEEKTVIPRQWLEKKDLPEFKQLLTLNCNVKAIHLCGWYGKDQLLRIMEMVFSCDPKLTALTVFASDDCYEIMNILRVNEGRMEYVSVSQMELEDVIELIQSNPYMKAIHSNEMSVDFVNNYIAINHDFDGTTTTMANFWSHLKSFNSISGKLGSNDGLKGISFENDWLENANDPIYEEIVSSHPEIELLQLHYNCRDIDISRLEVKKNMKFLRFCHVGNGETSDGIGEILSNFNKLEELDLHRIIVPAITWMKIHQLCPQLRKLSICMSGKNNNATWYKTDEALGAVCLLPKLEYYRVQSETGNYILKSSKEIAEKKLQLNVAGGTSESVGQSLVANT